MKRTAVLLLAVAALAVGLHAAFARQSVQTGVVVVNTNLAYENGAAAGTGIVLTPSGEVLTNNHVIRGATTIHVVFPGTHKTYSARVLGYSVDADVALLQLQHASGLPVATIGSSAKLARGQSVTAVGNAGGTGSLTVTTGQITGLHRTITVNDEGSGAVKLANLIEVDASLQPGDSGGPLLDENGRVVGIDSAASEGFSFQGTNDGYAIPIDRAVAIAKQIATNTPSGRVHVGGTPFLGVQVQASPFGAGELVTGVVRNSPAAKAGITAGATIVAVGSRAVNSQAAVVATLVAHHPGDRIAVKWIDRSDARHTATVVLASGPPQ